MISTKKIKSRWILFLWYYVRFIEVCDVHMSELF